MRNRYTILMLFLFSTSLLFAQTPIHPANGNTVVKSTTPAANLTVSWTAFGSATTYDYEFQIDSTGWSILANTAATSFTIPYSSLAVGNVVTWRVRDNNTGVPGVFINYSFTISPDPTPTPANNTFNVNVSTSSLSWTAFDEGGWGNGNYDVEFGTDPTFVAAPLASLYNTATTSLSLPVLSYNTTYYWRVKDTDIDGAGGDGGWFSFQFTTQLSTPVLSSPANHAFGQSITPTLSWTLSGNSSNVQYTINYTTDSTFTTFTTLGPQAATSVVLPTLLYNELYYWRVNASVTSGSNTSTQSTTWHFITLLGIPTLTTPANNAIDQALITTFTWAQPSDTNFTKYYVDYDTTGTFASPTTLGPVYAPAFSITTTLPFYYQKYYWRVRSVATGTNPSRHNAGETTTSSTFNFRTRLAPPTLISVAPPAQVNYAVGVSITPTFTWSTVTGAQTYELILATDAGFTSVVKDTSGLATNSFVVPNSLVLTNGVTYYWKVRATRSTGPGSPTTSNWSTRWQFITVTPAQPYLTNPANGSTISGGFIYFSWYSGVYGIQYRLQVTTYGDAAFSSPFIDVTSANTFYTTSIASYSQFVQGGAYIWRVISETVAPTPAIIDFSTTWQFYLPGLPQPYASYPTGNVYIYNNPPTLYWYIGVYNPQVTQYIVRYRRSDQTYQSYPVTSSNLYGTFATGSANLFVTIPYSLDAGYQYYWEVAAWDGTTSPASLTNWSTETSFTVYGNITFIISYPTYPVGGGTIYINPPTLYWYTNIYAPGLYFAIQYSTDNTFASGVTTVYSSSTSYTLGSTLSPGHYYWRVAASFIVASYPNASYGPWSASGDFVVTSSSGSGSSAAMPILTYPTGGLVITTVQPTLSWYAYSSTPLEFQVNYSANSHMTAGYLDLTNSTSLWLGTTSYVTPVLTPGATYYWQVRSRQAGNSDSTTWSGWSTVSYFTLSPGAAAVVPLIGSPNYGQPINSNSAILSWITPAKSTSQLNYDVQYSTDPEMKTATTIPNVSNNYVKVDNLKLGTYYWRALSRTNNGSVSAYSSIGSFKTGGLTNVPEEQTVPAAYELSQNYPNPFNPETIIGYQLPVNSYVTLKIYDILGREVATLVNQMQNAGNYKVGFNSNQFHLSSGIYFYRIHADKFVQSKKMILLK